MDRSERIIVVTGATGHQGGAAARHLLADGWRVRAFLHHTDSPEARALAEAGAELTVGDFLDRASLDSAMAGAYGAYSVQTPREGPDVEIEEAHNVAEAAKTAGVEHFVYSSVIGADQPSQLPWVTSKHQVEPWLATLGMPTTVFRPATFMENLLGQADQILAGTLSLPQAPDYVNQRIAADDIGRFIALAFREPDNWIGMTMEIAADERTGPEAASALSSVLGVPVAFEQTPPPDWMPAPDPNAPPPARADIAKCRSAIPGLRTFEEWAAEMRANGVW